MARIATAVLMALLMLSGVFALQTNTAFGAEAEAEAEGAEALSPGAYIVAAHPYYAHPVTGVMEDSGQNPGIGQGMTESVLGKEALLEVYDGGATFVTVRFSLMDYIEDVEISAQETAEDAYTPVAHTVMQESIENGTADIRFEIPGESAIVRAEFFVTAMGRVVIFFMDFSDPAPGSGDFLVTDAPPAQDSLVFAKPAESVPAEAGAATDADFSGGITWRTFLIVAGAAIAALVVISAALRVRKKKKDAAQDVITHDAEA